MKTLFLGGGVSSDFHDDRNQLNKNPSLPFPSFSSCCRMKFRGEDNKPLRSCQRRIAKKKIPGSSIRDLFEGFIRDLFGGEVTSIWGIKRSL